MKRKLSLLAIVPILGSALWLSYSDRYLKAVTDTCSGVVFTMNANYPNTVQPGQNFTLDSITAQPASSYGMTIHWTELTLSSTYTTTTSYVKNQYGTIPSPTTGHPTYTAYFPDWALKANNDPGKTIQIKLVKTRAMVDGIGLVTCNFTATLASINIAAPPSGGGGSGGGSGGGGSGGGSSGGGSSSGGSGGQSSNPTSSSTPSAAPATPAEGTPSNQASSGNQQTTTAVGQNTPQTGEIIPLSTGSSIVVIDIKNGSNKPIEGAKVLLDGRVEGVSDSEGRVTFPDVNAGPHDISITHDGKTITKRIEVTSNGDNTLAVTFPSLLGQLKRILPFALGILLLSGAVGFVLLRKRQRLPDIQPSASESSMPFGEVATISSGVPPPTNWESVVFDPSSTSQPIVAEPVAPIVSQQPAPNVQPQQPQVVQPAPVSGVPMPSVPSVNVSPPIIQQPATPLPAQAQPIISQPPLSSPPQTAAATTQITSNPNHTLLS